MINLFDSGIHMASNIIIIGVIETTNVIDTRFS